MADRVVRVRALAEVIVLCLGKTLYSQSASLHPGVQMQMQICWGLPCDGLTSHPGGSSNIPSRFMLRKPELSTGPMYHLGLYKGFTSSYPIIIISTVPLLIIN